MSVSFQLYLVNKWTKPDTEQQERHCSRVENLPACSRFRTGWQKVQMVIFPALTCWLQADETEFVFAALASCEFTSRWVHGQAATLWAGTEHRAALKVSVICYGVTREKGVHQMAWTVDAASCGSFRGDFQGGEAGPAQPWCWGALRTLGHIPWVVFSKDVGENGSTRWALRRTGLTEV